MREGKHMTQRGDELRERIMALLDGIHDEKLLERIYRYVKVLYLKE